MRRPLRVGDVCRTRSDGRIVRLTSFNAPRRRWVQRLSPKLSITYRRSQLILISRDGEPLSDDVSPHVTPGGVE